MKIVYLHQYFATPRMAGGTRSYELATRLVKLGHEVHIVTSDCRSENMGAAAWRESLEDGVHVHWTPVPYRNEMNAARRIAAFVLFAVRAMRRAGQLKADVIFATSSPLTIAIPAIWAAKVNRIPMVFEIRDLWPAVPIAMGVIRNPVFRWAACKLERVAYTQSERVVALAPGMKDHVVEKGIAAERVSVIPNGSDVELFSGREGRAEAVRKDTPWLGDRPLIVYCGAIGQVNGLDYLVHLAAEAATLDPEVCFVVIGQGRMEYSVRELARSHDILDRNFFMLGALSKDDAATWICSADMTIALITGPEILWRHATQNKFFDSLAAGKPVANNFRGWQSEVAEDEGAGLILHADDIKLATRQLLGKLKDKTWMQTASKRAAVLGATRFNRDRHAEQLNDVLLSASAAYAERRKSGKRRIRKTRSDVQVSRKGD